MPKIYFNLQVFQLENGRVTLKKVAKKPHNKKISQREKIVQKKLYP